MRALGEQDAVVVGHDWGGLLGWTMAALHPRSVRRLVVLSMAHPRRLRAGMTDPRAAAGVGATRCGFQLPRLPERRLTRADDDPVADLMQRWAGPGRGRGRADFAEAVDRYRSASRIPQAAYGAMEYHRWAARSQLRPDGLRYARRMAAPITAPTLQLHGELDRCVLPRTARGSGRYVAGAYEWRELPGHRPLPPGGGPRHRSADGDRRRLGPAEPATAEGSSTRRGRCSTSAVARCCPAARRVGHLRAR